MIMKLIKEIHYAPVGALYLDALISGDQSDLGETQQHLIGVWLEKFPPDAGFTYTTHYREIERCEVSGMVRPCHYIRVYAEASV